MSERSVLTTDRCLNCYTVPMRRVVRYRSRVTNYEPQERGGITLLVLVMLVAFAIILGAGAALISRQAHQITQQKEIERAFNVAEAGIHYTVWHLNESGLTLSDLKDDIDAGQWPTSSNAEITDGDNNVVGTFAIVLNSVTGTEAEVQSIGSVPNVGLCQTINTTVERIGTKYAITVWNHVPSTVCVTEHTIFVTSTTTTGNIGGITGADTTCRNLAADASLAQPNQYRAVLSDSATDARTHITVNGPIYNVQDDLIATDASDLWDGELLKPVYYDETGVLQEVAVWTGTNTNGSKQAATTFCGNWNLGTGTGPLIGFSEKTDAGWIAQSSPACATNAHLYCLGPR